MKKETLEFIKNAIYTFGIPMFIFLVLATGTISVLTSALDLGVLYEEPVVIIVSSMCGLIAIILLVMYLMMSISINNIHEELCKIAKALYDQPYAVISRKEEPKENELQP